MFSSMRNTLGLGNQTSLNLTVKLQSDGLKQSIHSYHPSSSTTVHQQHQQQQRPSYPSLQILSPLHPPSNNYGSTSSIFHPHQQQQQQLPLTHPATTTHQKQNPLMISTNTIPMTTLLPTTTTTTTTTLSTPTTSATATSSPVMTTATTTSSSTATTTGLDATSSNLWIQRMMKMRKCVNKQAEIEYKRRQILTREEVTMQKNTAKSLCAGDIRLQSIRKQLDSVGIVRSSDQIAFHEAFLAACLPKIYKEEWSQHSVRVMREMKLKEIEYEVLAMTPRRWGKTWSVALFCLALLLHVPGIKICVFSTGKRASGGLMQIILDFLAKVEGGIARIKKQNQEELFIGPPSAENKQKRATSSELAAEAESTSKLFSFPSSVSGK